MLFIAYHCTGAYKLYFPVTDKVEVSRDVIVEEFETWDWNKSQSNSSAVSTLEFDFTSEGGPASDGEPASEGEIV